MLADYLSKLDSIKSLAEEVGGGAQSLRERFAPQVCSGESLVSTHSDSRVRKWAAENLTPLNLLWAIARTGASLMAARSLWSRGAYAGRG